MHKVSSKFHSPRLKFIHGDAEILIAAATCDAELASILNVQVPGNWTSFGKNVFTYVLEKIKSSQEESEWWTYFPVLKQGNILIGCCGFKGAPDENGIVEIGYEVALEYRNTGLATEIAHALIQHAIQCKKVKSVIAHTLAEENASTRVLEKCKMKKVTGMNDRLKGQIWKWKYSP